MKRATAWPYPGIETDPFADEPPMIRPVTDDEPTRHFLVQLDRADSGEGPITPDMVAFAEDNGLNTAPRSHPRFRRSRCDAPTSPERLSRIALDLCPAAGAEAADRFLGPWSLDLQRDIPRHRKALQMAIAAQCFALLDGDQDVQRPGPAPGLTPYEKWKKSKPRPSREDRARVGAIARTPMGVYSLESDQQGRWWLADRIGLTPELDPGSPVDLSHIACPMRDPQAGDTLVARLVECDGVWHALAGFVWPSAPPSPMLQAWTQLALWRARLYQPRASLELTLRIRSEWICRRVAEWAWMNGDDDPYSDGVLYDLEYTHQDEDLNLYRGLAQTLGGPVLELGCGTGRLAIALAQAGHDVHGIDRAPGMLEQMHRRVSQQAPEVQSRIQTSCADARGFQLNRQFPLVLWPFNALHYCRRLEDVHAVLSCVRQHLTPDGLLAIDCYLPDLALYDRDPHDRVEPREFTHPETGELLTSWEQGWWDPQLQIHHVVYAYQHSNGRILRSHLQFRMHTLAELTQMLTGAGWQILHQAQDFNGTPVDEGALKWVGVLRPA